MRSAVLVVAGALGLMAAASANATPAVSSLGAQQDSNVVQVAGGCGPRFHPNRWGRCVPFRYGYYGPRPYWRGYYARPWSGDYGAAEQLNRREMGRIYGY